MIWQIRVQIQFSMKGQVDCARQLLITYLNKPYIYHLNQNSATLSYKVSSGPATVFSGMMIPLFSLITELITAATIWLMLIIVDPFTAIVVAGIMGLMMYSIMRVCRKTIVKQGRIQNQYATIYGKWINQSLGAIKETKILRKEKYFLQEFVNAYNKYSKASSGFLFLNQLPRMFIELLVVSALLLLIVIKLLMGFTPIEIVPLLGVLALAAFRLMPCANRVINLFNGIKFQMPLFNEMYSEFSEIKIRQMNNIKDVLFQEDVKLPFVQDIVIKNVGFSYPKANKNVLKDINIFIPKGSFVGIIGQSGAGKTTFVDILLGLIKPLNGSVYVDGIDVFSDIRAWQANLGYVPQNIYLIDGSISENIALGVAIDEVDNNKMDEALKMAELFDFVNSLPEKLATNVGERGVKLSGGQRQRIGIARALYCEPKVLILDEATSALDTETEKFITNTILKLKGQMTIIAIAHRTTTLEQCDYKIKFEAGKAKRIN